MANKEKLQNESGIKNTIVSYFKGVKTEWGKITWPDKKQVIVETFYVLVIVFIFTIFILLLDVSFKGILKLLNLI